MPSRARNVLFLCTGNSARSILAESTLNALGGGRFRAHSAGSHPTGVVHPLALDLLAKEGYPVEGARSKSWDEFARVGAPALDIVITVCDAAAGESCPAFPGKYVRAHWGIADPAAVAGPDARRDQAFREAFAILRMRIQALTSLDFESLGRDALENALRVIGSKR